MKEISAYTSGSILTFLSRRHSGRVLLVTSKGIYTELDGRVLLWCPDTWGLVPMGISTKEFPVLRDCNLRDDQPLIWDGNALIFPQMTLRVRIAAGKRELVPAEPEGHAVQLSMQQLAQTGKVKGIVPLLSLLWDGAALPWNLYCQTAMPALRLLLRLNDAPAELKEAVCTLLGLGVGLTPSGDDFLCGFLYLLLRSKLSGYPAVVRLAELVLENAPKRTNQISAAFLTGVARGETCEAMDRMIRILGGAGETSIQCMTEIGSSSGSEMLLGMLAACKLLLEYQEEKS